MSEQLLNEDGDFSQEELESLKIFQESTVKIRDELAKVIVGQEKVIDQLLVAIFSKGHCLLEGVPGLAKTLMVSTLAKSLRMDFNRIQFTPDLMPSDITGTEVIQEDKTTGAREFKFLNGPVFANVVLADEINRTPPKTQAAMLEAMQERQVTVGMVRHELPDPFFVLATQNPIEQEGTYPLPEAQIDRFMFKVLLDYPEENEELDILNKMGTIKSNPKLESIVSTKQIFSARKLIDQIYIADNIKKYIVSLVLSTRNPASYGMKDLQTYINLGASPRATVFLATASKAQAFLNKRGYVIPEDVREVGRAILRHRIITTYEAEAEEVSTENIIQRIYESIATP